jgi:hypothetical protein
MSAYLWLPPLNLPPAARNAMKVPAGKKELTFLNPSECLRASDTRVTYAPSYSSPEMEMLRAILGSFSHRIL